jgi:hypothetical protein
VDYETKPFTKPELDRLTLAAATGPNTQSMTPRIKMFVSDWLTDALGNKAHPPEARGARLPTPGADIHSGCRE